MRTRNSRRKVPFGTNYPMIFHEPALADLDAIALDQEARTLFVSAGLRTDRPQTTGRTSAEPPMRSNSVCCRQKAHDIHRRTLHRGPPRRRYGSLSLE